MNPLCIYHGACDDGFAAAWAVRKALGAEVDFYPGVYQKDPPPHDAYAARIGQDRCYVSNAPYFAASEVAGELCGLGDASFGACYFEAKQGRFQYSLRSRGDFDVSTIARKYGGGGHKNAAGFFE